MKLINFLAAINQIAPTIEQQAKATGFSERTIYDWRAGRAYPRIDKVVSSPAAHILKPALGQDLIANGHDKAA